MAPDSTSGHRVFHCHVLAVKEKKVSLNAFIEVENLLVLLNLMKWEVCLKYFCAYGSVTVV